MDYKKQSQPDGFTIVELLVVIVVIGILAAITIVSYTGISQKATIASLQSDLDNASRQLKLDQVLNSNYPDTLAAANSNRGIPASSGTTYQYSVDNSVSPQTFCITATKGITSYKITNNSSPVAGVCPDYGLDLYLDAGNIASYPSPFTGTTWTDLSGNSNNGALLNGVGYSNNAGGTLVFDGVDDYLTIPNDIVTTSNIRLNGVTYSAWVKSVNTTTEQRIVGQKPSSGYSDFASGGLGIFSNKAKMIAYDDNLSYKSAIGNTSLLNNTWYFIVGTYDATDKNIRIFVNGSVDGTAVPITTFDRLIGNNSNTIGRQDAAATYSFNGSISNVRIYNRALSAAEIQQIFTDLRGRYGL